MKLLELRVSDQVYAEVQELSKNSHRTVCELVRVGLGLAKILLENETTGNLLLVTKEGRPIKELVWPSAS